MNPATSLPQHIAVIMDGNGRWAKKRFMPRFAGHRAGVDAARRIVKNCALRGIKVLTLFAFSSENWRRPQTEVNHLMELFMTGLEREAADMHKNKIRLRFIGDRTRFSAHLTAKINEVEQLTANNAGMTLLIAADYGGQWDITEATKRIAADVAAGAMQVDDITPQQIAVRLSFADLPDPDLFIRTSGEMRISNFLLWQLAYAELYFTEVLWPDFGEKELDAALAQFASRERRFGYSSEQLQETACSGKG
jgi:undecaprenyl diphosphate synthase